MESSFSKIVNLFWHEIILSENCSHPFVGASNLWDMMEKEGMIFVFTNQEYIEIYQRKRV
jgi:hypothetical protein